MQSSRPRIGLSYWRDRGNPRKRRAFESLADHAAVVWLDPEREHHDLATLGLDLFHAAKRRPASLADLDRAAAAGIETVNPAAAVGQTSDRLARHEALVHAGVPVPRAEFGSAATVSLTPPVLVKTREEGREHSHDHEFVTAGPVRYDGERLVEAYVPHTASVKVHVVGEAVRAVRESPAGLASVPLDPGLESIVRRVRHLFGLRVFELDAVRLGAGSQVPAGTLVTSTAEATADWVVVDVNPVVSLAGVPDAVAVYRDFLGGLVGVEVPARVSRDRP
ncbi:hypothetical protein [Haloarchaeobius amylolyticus]|uniref:hypothetical protein n=1 Tax=Haloarchaeobius amylolyticus TaxID=1198296 RepID=UPI00226E8273|nr:hypothetical protein [Haloarchaeobius amylolyticus]